MGFPRPRFDIADIVRTHRPALEAQQSLSKGQKRVLTDISQCRTAALGGHLEVCTACGREHPVYNSCRNRHCPKCQALTQEKWIAAVSERLLSVRHFHVVFTPPSELRPLARRYPALIYRTLFKCVMRVLLQLFHRDHSAIPGLVMVLHTWTRKLEFHPHVHTLVSAGGLSTDGSRFVKVKKDFLFPVKVMGKKFRGKVLAALRRLNKKNAFPELEAWEFDRLMEDLAAHKCWVVYAKKPLKNSLYSLKYLGRYIHRVGISNSRILDVGPEHVTFRTKGTEQVTLTPVEFLKRFVQHVLPAGFHKVRYGGLYASLKRGGKLEQARALLPPKPMPKPFLAIQDSPPRCPKCGELMVVFPLPRPPPKSKEVICE